MSLHCSHHKEKGSKNKPIKTKTKLCWRKKVVVENCLRIKRGETAGSQISVAHIACDKKKTQKSFLKSRQDFRIWEKDEFSRIHKIMISVYASCISSTCSYSLKKPFGLSDALTIRFYTVSLYYRQSFMQLWNGLYMQCNLGHTIYWIDMPSSASLLFVLYRQFSEKYVQIKYRSYI